MSLFKMVAFIRHLVSQRVGLYNSPNTVVKGRLTCPIARGHTDVFVVTDYQYCSSLSLVTVKPKIKLSRARLELFYFSDFGDFRGHTVSWNMLGTVIFFISFDVSQ